MAEVSRTFVDNLVSDEIFVESLINSNYFQKLMRERIIEPMVCGEWVLPEHLERMCGMRFDQVRSKKRYTEKSGWIEGVHFKFDPQGTTWVNWRAIQEWVISGELKETSSEKQISGG